MHNTIKQVKTVKRNEVRKFLGRTQLVTVDIDILVTSSDGGRKIMH